MTGTGDVVSTMRPALRDNSGYDVASLVCGSEGTLGVITRARLRHVAKPAARATALLRFGDAQSAVTAAEELGQHPSAESLELFFGAGIELVCRTYDLRPPFGTTTGGYVLVEAAGPDDVALELAAVVDRLDGVSDVAVALDSSRRAALWRLRELHPEAIATLGVMHKLDVALPAGALGAFVARVRDVVQQAAPGGRTWLFGHGGESSVHVNITGSEAADDAADEAVIDLVCEMNGSISAEHGIGRSKRRWVHRVRSDQELRLLRDVKHVFDPMGS